MRDPATPPRAFSIAAAWIGLVAGGLVWILYWGARNLPARGSTAEWRPTLDVVDLVLLVVMPLAIAAAAGRLGRNRLP
ncbi:MAG: hypothetical protein KDB80_14025 [Planctomycetes bacterium]|nr:hypothetical protein [Planctomycetota bacterium]